MVTLLTLLTVWGLWMIPGLFVSRWWYRKNLPDPYDDGFLVGQTIAVAFFWPYFLVGYFSWGFVKKFYGVK